MKRCSVLWVREPAERFLPLVRAATAAGHRVGWLQLDAPPSVPALEPALAAGALRAVAVGEGRALALKGSRGLPVLDDLLRQYFLGCRLVLVRGEGTAAEVRGVDRPGLRLESEGEDAWRLTGSRHTRRLDTAALVSSLRRPHGLEGAPEGAPKGPVEGDQ